MHGQFELRTAPHCANTARGVRRAIVTGMAFALLAGVGTARASDEFEAAFEYELGRIAAHHVVEVGHLFFWGFYPRHGYGHEHHRGCGHWREYRGHRHRAHHRSHYDGHYDRHHDRHHYRHHRRHHERRDHHRERVRRRHDDRERHVGNRHRDDDSKRRPRSRTSRSRG